MDRWLGSVALERSSELAPTHPGEVATLLPAGSGVLSPLAILFCLVLPFFGLHRCGGRNREIRFVSNWFQEAGARPLFFQSKAEMVRIRTGSVKSILRGSVCVGGWGLVLTTIISHLNPFPRSEMESYTLPSPPGSKVAAEWPRANHRGATVNPTEPDIFGVSWSQLGVVTPTPPSPGSLP